MNLLLDTHALLWFFNGDKQLTSKARKAIESTDNNKYVSVASLLEIAIKVSLNKLQIKKGYRHIGVLIEQNGFTVLPLNFEHSVILADLQFYHRDPFDRMLISQAISEKFSIVTTDANFKKYPVNVIW